jgi:hypothetical protein
MVATAVGMMARLTDADVLARPVLNAAAVGDAGPNAVVVAAAIRSATYA